MRTELDDRERQVLDDTNRLRALCRKAEEARRLLALLIEPSRTDTPSGSRRPGELPTAANLHVLDVTARLDETVLDAGWLTLSWSEGHMPRGVSRNCTILRLRFISENAAVTARKSPRTVSEITNQLTRAYEPAARLTGLDTADPTDPKATFVTCPRCQNKSMILDPTGHGRACCTICDQPANPAETSTLMRKR